ncbi:MAG: glucose-6-phosphate isomerase [Bacillota bacterium]
MRITFDEKHCYNAVSKEEIDDFIDSNSGKINSVLKGELGLSNFLGWHKVKTNAGGDIVWKNQEIADEIRKKADAFVIVGVGGSNRSAQTLIEGLCKKHGKVEIFYGGNNLSGGYLERLLESLKGRSVYVNVIAKDFNTLEPGIAFRMLRDFFKKEYGKKYKNRIILTGSEGKGQLFEVAKEEGFRFLHFPKEVGGRFTAFTSVSFLPMMVAGVSVDKFVSGGKNGEDLSKSADLKSNIAVRYACVRHLLAERGFFVQNFCYFEPSLEYFAKWALQLHGESEGKNGKSILPIISNFSEDLHAIGQYIQEGRKCIFETFLDLRVKTNKDIAKSSFADGFEYLDGKKYDILNEAVLVGSRKAHFQVGIPVMTFSADKISEKTLGELMYIFMMSTYIASVLIDVEPFDQNGVEDYKRNMYEVLGKEGKRES